MTVAFSASGNTPEFIELAFESLTCPSGQVFPL